MHCGAYLVDGFPTQTGGSKSQVNEAAYSRFPVIEVAKRLSPLFDLTSTVVHDVGDSTAVFAPTFSLICSLLIYVFCKIEPN
ncbi:MAG: hypothetical protein UR20_C0030G0007 [Candidatus Woesebacteria bacterium GW2011_GWE2_31_6]|nr:MAG: hypothetical protein UR20_C0030G0007 [Candidatus Woesebacteria bacterium GW2011_GWE2_31_6]